MRLAGLAAHLGLEGLGGGPELRESEQASLFHRHDSRLGGGLLGCAHSCRGGGARRGG